jgi:hypothetical protein
MPDQDSGNSIRMGNVRGPSIVVGRDMTGGSITQQTTGQAGELHDLFAELRREIETHADELSDPAELRDATDSLESEIQSANPKPGTIRTLLRGMTAGAGQITSLVEVIARLENTVRTAF